MANVQFVPHDHLKEKSAHIYHKHWHIWSGIKKNLICPILVLLTLKEAGAGPKVPAGQEIACHFSQEYAMVTKNLDFIHKHPN